jgi:HTH domain
MTMTEFPRNFIEPRVTTEPRLPMTTDFIFYSDITIGPRILYAFLVKKATELDASDGGISIPMETLGRKLNISYATIHKYIQKLLDLGFITVEQNTAGHNRYWVSHYWVENV